MSNKFKCKLFIIFIITIYCELTIGLTIINNTNINQNEVSTSRTVKKQLSNAILPDNNHDTNNLNLNTNNQQQNNNQDSAVLTGDNAQVTIVASGDTHPLPQSTTVHPSVINNNNHVIQKVAERLEIPDSYRIGFYIFIGMGLIAVLFFSYRSYRLRLSRAERRYGVHGDRRAQELTPLPISIEDDSDTEDHTVFDINKQLRIS